MADFNLEENRTWVMEQIASLEAPAGWQPDGSAALVRFRRRERFGARPVQRAGWLAWAGAVAVGLCLVLLLPLGRSMAQQVWQLLIVRRVAFIRVKPWPAGVPSPQVNLIGTPLPPIPERDAADARHHVGYAPRLPHPGVLSDTPVLYSQAGVSAGTVVKVADLVLALRTAGINDAVVPPRWEGAKLAVHTSALVLAQWPDLALAQSLPPTLSAPPGFDFSLYSALILRVLGVEPREAVQLASQMGTAPPWLAPLTRDFASGAKLEKITLNSGPATLLEQKESHGSLGRIVLAWSVPDRVYLLSGNVSRQLAISVANAVE